MRQNSKKPGNSGTGLKLEESPCQLVVFDVMTMVPLLRLRFEDGLFTTVHASRHEASLNPRRLAFSPDGRHILIGCNGLILIETATGDIVRQYDLEPPK